MVSMSLPMAVSNSTRTTPARRLAATVYEEIKSGILSGQYRPGEWLSVETICQTFRVSRHPVMEAMRQLSGEWLVEIVPQVGCRVAQYDQNAVKDYLAVIGDLEGHVAGLAAERRTSEQLDQLAKLIEQVRPQVGAESADRALWREIHRVLLDMAHTPVVARLCDQLWDFGDFIWRMLSDLEPDQPNSVQRQYETLLQLSEAIQRKNANLARLHMTIWLTGTLPV
ncbi:GntR family transcriptional regulator [Nocardia sp. R7R-8]|uniref:GntR family transcriptional regulator n=1 Tax=Nocardia sp. R7R-8 TaxID=3459304 RepID=UPI00403DC6B3